MSLNHNKIATGGPEAASMAQFGAKNATTGTGIATVVSAALSDTACVLQLTNTNTPNVDKNQYIYPHMLELRVTAAPASGTSGVFELSLDNVDRYASGGSELVSVQHGIDRKTNWAARTSVGRVDFGAVVLDAEVGSSEITVRTAAVRSQIPVVGDTIRLVFGDGESVSSNLSDTAAAVIVVNCPPVRIAPGCSLILRQLYPSNATTPASFEVDCSWYESGHSKD
jgi:hypothetical protein